MLWVDNATAREMKPFADKLDTDVAKLVALVKTADYQTAQIANGAKSLMDEIGASKVTGEEDRYSHTDLYDFKANVDGARAVFTSLQPILKKRAPTLATTITSGFAEMDDAMAQFRRDPAGSRTPRSTPLTGAASRARSMRSRSHSRTWPPSSRNEWLTEPEALARAGGHRRRGSGRSRQRSGVVRASREQ